MPGKQERGALGVVAPDWHAERALEPEASFEPNTNFIEKPFDLDTLRAKIRSILDNIP